MPITVTRVGGSPQILSIRTALRQLPDEVDFVPILAEFGRGNSVRVILKDGTPALYSMTSSAVQPELTFPEELSGTEWPLETRPPSEAAACQPFNAHCKVLLEFDVFVQCTALDEVHAERVIQEVFRGERSPPAEFRTIFEREETEAFMRRLKLVFDTGDLTKAGVRDVLVTGFVEPVRALEYQP